MPNAPAVIAQYHAALRDGGYCDRDDRGLIEVCGADRAVWLNNLVTNVVKTLSPGEGNYTFAANIRGGVVFDASILVLEDRLWLDVDRRSVQAALSHLRRHLITEDVQLTDLSSLTRRFAAIGQAATAVAERLKLPDPALMAALEHVGLDIAGAQARWIRHDFVGRLGVELIMSAREESPAEALADAHGAILSGVHELDLCRLEPATINILRIEAGLPGSVDDVDEDVLPPETAQIERGISHHKGCYLGQEIIERMRSHGVLARRLVGLRASGDGALTPGLAVYAGGSEVGRTRSGCWSEHLGAALSLAYVKSAFTAPGTVLTVSAPDGEHSAEVVALPVYEPHAQP